MLPCATTDAARIAGQLIARTVDAFALAAATVRITTSIGIGLYTPHSAQQADALLARADGALYQAKRAGKNRYAFAG